MLVVKPVIVAAIVAPLLSSSRRNLVVSHFPSLCDFSHKYAAQDHLHRVEMERWLHAEHPRCAISIFVVQMQILQKLSEIPLPAFSSDTLR